VHAGRRGTTRRKRSRSCSANRSVRYVAVSELVCYWREGKLVLHQLALGTRIAVTDLAIGIVAFCRVPRSVEEVTRAFPQLPSEHVEAALEELMAHRLLAREGKEASRRLESWAPWGPAATHFHYATRDVPWATGSSLQALEDAAGDAAAPRPEPIKRVRSSSTISLPRAVKVGEFPEVLLSRRTWRGFAGTPLRLDALGSLLDLTFGVRHWAESEHGERVMLRTSPSAGACHPIEAYVVASRVRGLAKGTYHYDPERHSLALVRPGADARQIERFLGGQWWYRKAAAIVVMTAMVERVRARYPYARAYRSLLLDAGHICQTFCLTATWLRLAPFCTMALADSVVEEHLRVDGVNEIVLYAAGVGNRPRGGHVQWPSRPAGSTYLAP
jgi:SagB-type dehydrogenase family enzyme